MQRRGGGLPGPTNGKAQQHEGQSSRVRRSIRTCASLTTLGLGQTMLGLRDDTKQFGCAYLQGSSKLDGPFLCAVPQCPIYSQISSA
jgi:hypothetical protein